METFELDGAVGPIRGDVRLANGSAASGAATGVVLCHGFKGFARWGFFPWLADRIAGAGLNAVTFDFSGSGVGADRESFTELDAFAADSFGRELADVATVMDEAARRGWIGPRAGLFGFSRGGGVAILHADRDARSDAPRVAALATWSAISSISRWSRAEMDAWRERGHVEVVNSRTGQVMRVGTDILDEVETQADGALSVLDAASRIAVPWLIVHGVADETVPVHEGRQLHTASRHHAELMLVERASHTYNSAHGMTEPTPELAVAAERTVRFFAANLGE